MVLVVSGSVGIAAPPTPPVLPAALGAFPVSDEVEAIWLVARKEADRKPVLFLVYLKGAAGWHRQKTSHTSSFSDKHTRITFFIGDNLIILDYDAPARELQLFGRTFDTTRDNVVLVTGMGVPGRFPKVVGLGRHDLTVERDENPATVILQREASLRSTILGG